MKQNLADILGMHEKLLDDLHNVVPYSEQKEEAAQDPGPVNVKGHVRWHSADGGIGKLRDSRMVRRMRHSIDMARPTKRLSVGRDIDTKTALAVARAFEKFVSVVECCSYNPTDVSKMPGLFAYEEYGAKFEMIGRGLAASFRLDHDREVHERGFEMLSRTVESVGARDGSDSRALRFQDLLIKVRFGWSVKAALS